MIQDFIHVEVLFALPEEQRIFEVAVTPGATVQDAIDASGILGWYPQIDLSVQKVGIFSKLTPLSQVVKEGDRIEIYRPVTADPKAMRRQQAKTSGPAGLATETQAVS